MHLCADTARRIVERVATGLATQISIMDASGQILASTDTHLIGQQHVLASDGLSAAEAPGVSVSLPLVYADTVVGAIALNDATPQGYEIARVAKTLAELIIHQTTVIDQLTQQKWVRNKFVYDLLHGHLHGAPESMEQEAAMLGLDLHAARVVAVVQIEGIVEQGLRAAAPFTNLPAITRALRLEQIYDQVRDQLQQSISAHPADVYSLLDERQLVILAVVDPHAPEARRRQLAAEFQRFLDTFAQADSRAAGAGIGWYHPGWQALAQSYAEAQFALATGVALQGTGRVFQVEDLGLAAFIGSDSQALKADLGQHLIGPIADEFDLLATLEAFFSANLSPSLTAQRLHIHRHTLAYRLDKIARLIGHDPRCFDVAAKLYAALLLRKIGGVQAYAPAPG